MSAADRAALGLVVTGLLVSAAIGVLASWLDRPKRLTLAGTVSLLTILVAVAVTVTSRDRDAGATTPEAPPQLEASPARPGEYAGKALSKRLAARRLLFTDDSAGRPILFMQAIRGGERTKVWDMPPTTDFIVAPGPHIIMSVPSDDGSHLELSTLEGELMSVLTRPGPRSSDVSPVLAAGIGRLYFVRETWSQVREGTSTVVDRQFMHLTLDLRTGRVTDPPRAANLGVELNSISVSRDGRTIVGTCDAPDGSIQACVRKAGASWSRVRLTRLGSTIDDMNVSAEGRWLAYSAPVPNPYGETQIYVVDLHADKPRPVMVSRFAGHNSSPQWTVAEGPGRPPLVFSHWERVAGSSIVLIAPGVSGALGTVVHAGSDAHWLP